MDTAGIGGYRRDHGARHRRRVAHPGRYWTLQVSRTGAPSAGTDCYAHHRDPGKGVSGDRATDPRGCIRDTGSRQRRRGWCGLISAAKTTVVVGINPFLDRPLQSFRSPPHTGCDLRAMPDNSACSSSSKSTYFAKSCAMGGMTATTDIEDIPCQRTHVNSTYELAH
jgi:hypothetical protein